MGAAPAATNIAKNKERKDTIIMMNGGVAKSDKPVTKVETSQQLSQPVTGTKNDSIPLVKNEPAIKPEEKTTAIATTPPPPVVVVPQNAIAKKDSVPDSARNEIAKSTIEKPDSIVNPPVKRLRPLVNKAAELLTDTSYVAVFVDESNDKFDTIRISIPFDEYAARTTPQKQPVTDAKLADSSSDAGKLSKENAPVVIAAVPIVTPEIKKDTPIAEKNIKDTAQLIATQQPINVAEKKDSGAIEKTTKDSVPVVVQQAPPPVVIKNDTNNTVAKTVDTVKDAVAPEKKPAQAAIINSDCKETAFDIDIDKLRIKMLLVTSDDEKITLAKKVFKQKCFSVKQVRALSELFKSDEGKYKWFDAVYPYVSDTGNFSLLGELIKNEYYLNRFKAMLRN